MNSKLLILISAAAFLLLGKKRSSNSTPILPPTQLPTGDPVDDGVIDFQVEDDVPQVCRDLSVKPELVLYDANSLRWRGTLVWRIKNSGTTTYTIGAVRSTLSVMGYVSVWVPGRRDVVRRVAPGQTVEIDATIVDKYFFAPSDKQARETVEAKLLSNQGKALSLLMANVDVDAWSSNNQMKTLCSYENVQGTVQYDKRLYYPGYRGEGDAQEWEWNEATGFRK